MTTMARRIRSWDCKVSPCVACTSSLRHPLLPLGVCAGRRLVQGWELWLGHKPSDWWLTVGLDACPRPHPPQAF